MENRYYVKLYWSHTGNLSKQEVSFMIEADSKDQIKQMVDPKHEILEITRV